jgi:hypothetical protein
MNALIRNAASTFFASPTGRQLRGDVAVRALAGRVVRRLKHEVEDEEGGGKKNVLEFYLPGAKEPFARWDNGPEGVFDHEGSFGFGRDTHLQWVPAANVVIAVPKTNDRVILHRFDLDKELAKAGVDYLFVTSQPPPVAKKGDTYSYQPTAKAKKGDVMFRVDAGPPGMKVDGDGKLTWPVPPDFAEGEVSVILTAAPGGQETFHTFRLVVVK